MSDQTNVTFEKHLSTRKLLGQKQQTSAMINDTRDAFKHADQCHLFKGTVSHDGMKRKAIPMQLMMKSIQVRFVV